MLVFLAEQVVAGRRVVFAVVAQTVEQEVLRVPKLVLNLAHHDVVYVFLVVREFLAGLTTDQAQITFQLNVVQRIVRFAAAVVLLSALNIVLSRQYASMTILLLD